MSFRLRPRLEDILEDARAQRCKGIRMRRPGGGRKSRKGNSREHIKGTFQGEHRARIFVCQGSRLHKCGFDRGRLRPRPFWISARAAVSQPVGTWRDLLSIISRKDDISPAQSQHAGSIFITPSPFMRHCHRTVIPLQFHQVCCSALSGPPRVHGTSDSGGDWFSRARHAVRTWTRRKAHQLCALAPQTA